MYILGMIFLVVGALLFFGSKIMYKKYEKAVRSSSQSSKDEDFLILVNNAMFALKAIGAIMVISGGIFLVFVK